MTTKAHKKKRNVGLLYEFLVKTISRSLVEGEDKSSQRALRVLKRHFKPTSQLFREFRLINSLVKTTVSSEAVAGSILQEAKRAARSVDAGELDKQKSFLIRDINHVINDPDFYDQHVNEYKIMATIQTLINDWRDPDADLNRMAQYEDQLVSWLTTTKHQPTEALVESTPGTNRLLMKVMMKKLNEKYSGVLNDDQKALIRAYAFSTANDETMSVKLKMKELRESLVSVIDSFVGTPASTSMLDEKLIETKKQLVSESLEHIDDEVVTRFMLYTKLKSEIERGDNDDS